MNPNQLARITATQLQQQSAKVLRRVFRQREHVLIERAGYPVAVIIPLQDYERLTNSQASST